MLKYYVDGIAVEAFEYEQAQADMEKKKANLKARGVATVQRGDPDYWPCMAVVDEPERPPTPEEEERAEAKRRIQADLEALEAEEKEKRIQALVEQLKKEAP